MPATEGGYACLDSMPVTVIPRADSDAGPKQTEVIVINLNASPSQGPGRDRQCIGPGLRLAAAGA